MDKQAGDVFVLSCDSSRYGVTERDTQPIASYFGKQAFWVILKFHERRFFPLRHFVHNKSRILFDWVSKWESEWRRPNAILEYLKLCSMIYFIVIRWTGEQHWPRLYWYHIPENYFPWLYFLVISRITTFCESNFQKFIFWNIIMHPSILRVTTRRSFEFVVREVFRTRLWALRCFRNELLSNNIIILLLSVEGVKYKR